MWIYSLELTYLRSSNIGFKKPALPLASTPRKYLSEAALAKRRKNSSLGPPSSIAPSPTKVIYSMEVSKYNRLWYKVFLCTLCYTLILFLGLNFFFLTSLIASARTNSRLTSMWSILSVFMLHLSSLTADVKVLVLWLLSHLWRKWSAVVIGVWAREEKNRQLIMKRYVLREEGKVWQKSEMFNYSISAISGILFPPSWRMLCSITATTISSSIPSSYAWMIIISEHEPTLQWN